MRAIEKMWTVVYKIDEARQITPTGNASRLHHSTFDKIGSRDDVDFIFEKLANDYKVIELLNIPVRTPPRPGQPQHSYSYIFRVLPRFDAYYEDLYTKYSFGADKLNNSNFLKVFDVMLDIEDKLNIKPQLKIQIPLMPHIVRFGILLPKDTIHFRDEYCQSRWDGAEFLKNVGVAKSVVSNNPNSHRWEGYIVIELTSRLEFERLLEKMRVRYKKDFHKTTTKLPKETSIAAPIPEQEPKNDKPVLNLDLTKPQPVLSFGKNKTSLDDSTIEYFVIKEVIESYPKPAEDDNIIEAWGGKEGKQTLYDANNRLNKKLSALLETKDKPLKHKNSRYWISDEFTEYMAKLTKTGSA